MNSLELLELSGEVRGLQKSASFGSLVRAVAPKLTRAVRSAFRVPKGKTFSELPNTSKAFKAVGGVAWPNLGRVGNTARLGSAAYLAGYKPAFKGYKRIEDVANNIRQVKDTGLEQGLSPDYVSILNDYDTAPEVLRAGARGAYRHLTGKPLDPYGGPKPILDSLLAKGGVTELKKRLGQPRDIMTHEMLTPITWPLVNPIRRLIGERIPNDYGDVVNSLYRATGDAIK